MPSAVPSIAEEVRLPDEYQSPAVTVVLTAEALAREVQYAGDFSNCPDECAPG